MRPVLFLVCMLCAGPAAAMGFHAKDLWGVRLKTSAFFGGTYAAETHAPNRVTLHCSDCTDLVVIDIQLTQGEEIQETKLRSGEMTIPAMRDGCAAWADACTLRAHTVGNAIGWVEEYTLGGRSGTTVRLYLDGEMLTIRSTAPDEKTAHGNGQAVLDAIAPLIVEGP